MQRRRFLVSVGGLLGAIDAASDEVGRKIGEQLPTRHDPSVILIQAGHARPYAGSKVPIKVRNPIDGVEYNWEITRSPGDDDTGELLHTSGVHTTLTTPEPDEYVVRVTAEDESQIGTEVELNARPRTVERLGRDVMDLAEQYAPILHFHPDEEFFPIRYEAYVENSLFNDDREELVTDPDLYDLADSGEDSILAPNTTSTPILKDFQDFDTYPETVYTSIHQEVSVPYDDGAYVAIGYWMFYVHDPKPSDIGYLPVWASEHTGDQEPIFIIFDDSGPQWVAAQQHKGGEIRPWEQIAKTGDHVHIYPAEGAHSNFFEPYAGEVSGERISSRPERYASEHLYQEQYFTEEVDSTDIHENTYALTWYADPIENGDTWDYEKNDYELLHLSKEMVWADYEGTVYQYRRAGEGRYRGEIPMQQSRWENLGHWIRNNIAESYEQYHAAIYDPDVPDPVSNLSPEDGRTADFEPRLVSSGSDVEAALGIANVGLQPGDFVLSVTSEHDSGTRHEVEHEVFIDSADVDVDYLEDDQVAVADLVPSEVDPENTVPLFPSSVERIQPGSWTITVELASYTEDIRTDEDVHDELVFEFVHDESDEPDLERVTPDRERLTVEPGTRLFFEVGPGDLGELPDRDAIEWSSDADPLWTQVQSYREFYPENDFEILEFGSTGTYDVEVEVTDEDGLEASIDWTVDVEPGGIEPPDTEQVSPDEHLLADPGETVDLELAVSDPDDALERVLWHYLHIASTPGIVDIDDVAAVEGDQDTTSAEFEIRDGNAWTMRGWVLDENGALGASESWRARSEFEVTITGTNDPLEPGDTLEVDVAVESTSELRDLQEIVLEVTGEDVDGEWIDLESGEGESVALRYDTSEDDVGDLEVTVRSIHDEDATQVTVGTDERDHELTVQPGTTVLFEAPLPDGVDSNDVEWFVDGESEGEVFFFGYRDYAENAVFSPTFETTGEYDVEARYPGGTDSVRWLVTVTETGAGSPRIEELSHDPSEGETIGAYDPIEITTTAHDPDGALDRVVWQEGRNQVGIYTDDISGERDTGTLEFDEPPLWIGAGYPTMAAVVSDDGRVSEIETQVGPEVRPPLAVEIVETNSPVTAGDRVEVTAAIENTGHIQLVGPTRQPIELDVGEETAVDSTEVDAGHIETETVSLSYETDSDDIGDLELTVRSPDHEATTAVTVEGVREPDIGFNSCTEVEITGEYDDVYLHASYLSGPTDAGVYVLETEPFPIDGDAVIGVYDHADTDAQLYVDSVSLSVDGEINPASPGEDVDETVENPLEKSLEGCEEARTGERPDASITLSDQSSDGESVTVDSVDLSHGGFVAVYDASDDGYHPDEDPGMPMEFQSTHVVGASVYLEAGTHEGLEVDFEEPLEGEQRLVAIPHRDSTESETFEFVESGGYVDWPYHSSPPYDDALVELEDEPGPTTDVAILETNDPVEAGELLEVVAQVENTGDEPVTQEVDLLVGGDRDHADSATVEVGPGDTETVTLVYETFPVDQDVSFPVSVVAGDTEAERTVDVHAEGPPEESGGLEVAIISAVDPVQGGEWFEVTVEVTNTGAGEVTQDVQFLVGESRELEDSRTVTVGPGETRTITLGYETYPVDQDVQFPVAVVTEDDEVTHTVDVLGTGSGPGEGTGTLSVTITGTNAPVDAGAFLEVPTLVENTGDAEATQEIRLLVGGDQVDTHSVTVDPGGSQTVTLGYETYPVQQDVEVTITVRSDDDSDSRTVTVFGQ